MKTHHPFAEIIRPIAEEAMSGVNAPALVRGDFTGQLERRLCAVLSQCLFLIFKAHRMSAEIFHGSREGCHASFLKEAAGQGVGALLRDFPVACDAIGVLGTQARNFAEDFATHLADDRKAVASLAGVPVREKVAKVTSGLSDPHGGGRTVVRVTFEDGAHVFYKPRSLAVEQSWQEGLNRINNLLARPLRAAATLDRGAHGWQEAITQRDELAPDEADAFYWRYGALLCLAWLLDATDIHRENVVICGPDPVLVDAEGLLHPFHHGEPRSLARTGLVPDGSEVDVSGLGDTGEQPGFPCIGWLGLGTDDLHMTAARSTIPAATHLPRVKGATVSPREARTHIQEGFEAMTAAALEDKNMIGEWHAELTQLPRRRIYRATVLYDSWLRRAAHPASLRSADDSRKVIESAQGSDADPIVAQLERAQLAQWDVPRFRDASLECREPPWVELDSARRELYDLLP